MMRGETVEQTVVTMLSRRVEKSTPAFGQANPSQGFQSNNDMFAIDSDKSDHLSAFLSQSRPMHGKLEGKSNGSWSPRISRYDNELSVSNLPNCFFEGEMMVNKMRTTWMIKTELSLCFGIAEPIDASTSLPFGRSMLF